MRKQIGSFCLSGAEWKVMIDNDYCNRNNASCSVWESKHEVLLASEVEGIALEYDNIMVSFWKGVISSLIRFRMEYGNGKWDAHYISSPYGNMVAQAYRTLTSHDGEWDGSVQIGGRNFNIQSQVYEDDDQNFGMCDRGAAIIYLKVETPTYAMPSDFIGQVLWHEICHAIVGEMGYSNTKLDSEKFINTLSCHLYEIVKTLKIEFPDEAN